jgi:hypothetical protein
VVPHLFHSLKVQRSSAPVRHVGRSDSHRPRTHTRLAVEALEDRSLMAAVLSVGTAMIVEGNEGVRHTEVVVTLSEPQGGNVTVNYHTSNDTALVGSDYERVSGKLTFAKGETSKTILVPVYGDRVAEPDEHFQVLLSTGVVTIMDDEPRISINDVSVQERNSDTTPFIFTVSLSHAADFPVTVDYATRDYAWYVYASSEDYAAASGTLTFEPGQTSQTILVQVNGDRLAEPNERFLVGLSNASSNARIVRNVGFGTIIDDEPRIAISNAVNYGETSFTFIVNLSQVYEVTVHYATNYYTAFAGEDYVATSGMLTFAPGETTKTITVDVIGDVTSWGDKGFTVYLRSASTNALIEGGFAWGYYYYGQEYYGDPWAGGPSTGP